MKKFLLAPLLLTCLSSANASVITSFGAGSAVSSADRMATFDTLSNSASLLNYSENNLIVSVDDTECCFAGVHYGNGGNNSFVTITSTDGADFYGLELDLLTGFRSGYTNVVWETKRDGVTTGNGVLTNIYAPTGSNGPGAVLGWSDIDLFDTLFIGAAPTSSNYDAFGEFQAIALDNVKAGLISPVPLPAAAWLFGSALVGWGVVTRQRKLGRFESITA